MSDGDPGGGWRCSFPVVGIGDRATAGSRRSGTLVDASIDASLMEA